MRRMSCGDRASCGAVARAAAAALGAVGAIAAVGIFSLAALPVMSSAVHAAPVRITYASWYQNPEDVALVKRFMDLNPDIKVIFTVPQADASATNWMRGWVEKIAVAAVGGAAPDVMRLNHETIVPFYQAGLLADLGPYVKKSHFSLADYFSPNVDLYKLKGTQRGIPLSINNYAIFYNKRMLAEAGVVDLNVLANQPGWTRDAFLDVARKLTRDTNGDRKIDVYGVDDNPYWVGRDIYVPQAGGSWFSADGKKCVFDSAETVDALKFMMDMKLVHKVWRPEGWSTGVWEKKSAMTTGAGWMVNNCLDAKIDFNVAPVFQYKATKWFPAAGDGIGISSTSKKKDAAWRFVQFMASKESEESQARAGIITPALISAAMGDAFAKSAREPKNKEAFFATMPNTAVFEPRFIRNEQSVFTIITKGFDDLWAAKKSPERVAQEIQASANRLL